MQLNSEADEHVHLLRVENLLIINYAKFYFSGQAADDDEEIESFTAENFEADVATNDEPKTETGKDEL